MLVCYPSKVCCMICFFGVALDMCAYFLDSNFEASSLQRHSHERPSLSSADTEALVQQQVWNSECSRWPFTNSLTSPCTCRRANVGAFHRDNDWILSECKRRAAGCLRAHVVGCGPCRLSWHSSSTWRSVVRRASDSACRHQRP